MIPLVPILVIAAAVVGVIGLIAIAERKSALEEARKDADRRFSPSPVGATGAPCPLADKTKKLHALMLEVAWSTQIKAARGRATIAAPHWRHGEDVTEGAGSKRPGVYLVEGKGGPTTLTAKVKIDACENVSGSGRLRAQFGSLFLEGACPLAVGEHTVTLKIKKLPAAITWHFQDVSWTLHDPADTTDYAVERSTRLEWFAVLDTPLAFYQNDRGVWVEVLRLLCQHAGVAGLSTQAEAAAAVASYAFGGRGLAYDTVRGAPNYARSQLGGTYQLQAYIDKSNGPTVNCYDQAGAVQAFAGALGCAVQWVYMEPYGYIKTTDLIGVGPCNNPFFRATGYNPSPVCDRMAKDRSAFGNHAFIALKDRIIDACAGPHTGAEDFPHYHGAAIDPVNSAGDPGGTNAGITAGLQQVV